MNKLDAGIAGWCVLIGVVAGLRSMTAPAVVVEDLIARSPDLPMRPLFRRLTTRRARSISLFNLIAEMAMDKAPSMPDRTSPASAALRCATGAASAAILASGRGSAANIGAAFGAAGALIGTFGGFHVRKRLSRHMPLPNAIVGLAEDAFALALAKVAVS